MREFYCFTLISLSHEQNQGTLNYFSSESFIFSSSLTCAVPLDGSGHSNISKQWFLSTTQRFPSLISVPDSSADAPFKGHELPCRKQSRPLATLTPIDLGLLGWKSHLQRMRWLLSCKNSQSSLLYLLLWSWKAKKTHCSQQQQKFLVLLKFFLGSEIIIAFLSTLPGLLQNCCFLIIHTCFDVKSDLR